VPCSGDGMLRKKPSWWSKWTVRHGLGLHRTQLAILKRALELLQPGPVLALIISTCSPLVSRPSLCLYYISLLAIPFAGWPMCNIEMHAHRRVAVLLHVFTEPYRGRSGGECCLGPGLFQRYCYARTAPHSPPLSSLHIPLSSRCTYVHTW
jgi:hypothetical protein